MTIIMIETTIVLIGLAVIPLLFFRFPRLPKAGNGNREIPKISVIIPARNEESRIPLLLKDLCDQSIKPLEIICVDDASSDNTAQIAETLGSKVISLDNKPEGWTGKAWACQNGADMAKGDLLLFLDADVRLGDDGMERLIQAYSEKGCAISVQPYHFTQRWYEQYSMLFNLIQIAANGTTLPRPQNIGLFGPIILMSRSDYEKVRGHESVRKSIVEDMALGRRLRDACIPYRIFVGDKQMSFRMYESGIMTLFRGWVKNIASGAAKTPLPLFVMVFLWISSMTSVPFHLIAFALSGNIPLLILYSLFYMTWVIVLYFLSKSIGHFKISAIVFYPVLIILLLVIFAVSIFKKIFGLKVIWKGRAVNGDEKPCK